VPRSGSPPPLRTLSSGKWIIKRNSNGVRVLQSAALNKIPWLIHGFSTRAGGVSPVEGEKTLNLGFTNWDARENVLENRRRFQSALRTNKFHLFSIKQFHSDVVHLLAAQPSDEVVAPADASITSQSGLLLAVQTADCVPILLVDSKKRVIAAIHAGWRGTLARIAQKAIGRMQMEFSSRPENIFAAIGPAIGGCCYEVGTEVASAFATKFADAENYFDELRTGDEPNPVQWLNQMPPGHQPPPPNVFLDLRKANRAQLLEVGVEAKNIFISELCTSCHISQLFSYRKEGAASGRLMAAIVIRPE
jgi:purine-nucleoside/S-methyl-5'-thioadenosine phosphorylase / adenosine deaminase